MNQAVDREARGNVQHEVLRRLRGNRRSSFSLRMTAMIDVIFLLLIFFVLTARFRTPEQFLPIQLPTPQARIERMEVVEPLRVEVLPDPRGCRVQIAAGGRSLASVDLLDQDPAQGLTRFTEQFADILVRQKRTTADPVEFFCHDQVTWDHLVKVYNVLYEMKLSDITFAVSPDEP